MLSPGDPHNVRFHPLRLALLAMSYALLCPAAPGLAQAPPVDWARLVGSNNTDEVNDIAADSSAVYAVGTTVAALPGHSNAGVTDVFVTKHDTAGNLEWSRQFGTSITDEGLGIAVSAAGVFVVGTTRGALPGQNGTGSTDGFLRRYDSNGVELWTRQFSSSGTFTDVAEDVVAVSNGVFVVGYTNGLFLGQTLLGTGGDDAFVAFFDLNGNQLWLRQFGSVSNDEAFGAAADATGVYITGRTNGAFPTQTRLAVYDVFLSKYDPSGTLLWHRQLSSNGNDYGYAVAAFGGAVYVAGTTAGTLPEGTSAGGFDVFLSRYDSAGNRIWTRQFGTSTNEEAQGVAASDEGIFVGGYTSGALPGFTTAGNNDVFLRMFDVNGNVRWTSQLGSLGPDVAASISLNSTHLFAGGLATGVRFLDQTGLGSSDGFVLRMGLAAPGQGISVSPASLTFNGAAGGAQSTQTLRISGEGGAAAWTATVSELNGSNWLGVSPPSGTATANLPSRLNVSVRFASLTPGVYQGVVQVRGPNNSSVRIPVTAVASEPTARVSVNLLSMLFRAQQGAAAARPQTLQVINKGVGTLSWSINPAAFSNAPWLTVAPLSGSTTENSRGSLVAVSANPAGLAAGTYQAVIPVASANALANPLLITVTLQVSAASAAGQGEVTPSGVVFVTTQGAAGPPAQSLTVNNAGGGSLTFQQSASTSSGGNWLSVSSAGGSLGSSAATAQITVNPASLAPGVYRGVINTTFSAGTAQDVEVALVVISSAALAARNPSEAPPRAHVCGPASMDLVLSTIGNGMTTPVSFPRALVAQVFDNCGDPVSNASLVASVDGQTLLMPAAGGGSYSATWTPARAASGILLRVVALHPSYTAVERTYTVSATAGGTLLPVVTQGGVVEGAGFTAGSPLAPGGIISVFGSQLASGEFRATTLPLPRELGGVSVRVGSDLAPLYYVGPTQINAQMPYSAPAGDAVSVLVISGASVSSPQNFVIAPAQPGVFVGGEFAAVLDGQSRAITADNPARIGDTLQIFSTGLGATDPPAATGAPAPAFSTVVSPVTVRIGDVQVPVVYQGLAPGFVGLYQVNVVLTPEAPRGGTASLVVTQNGIVSNPNLPTVIPIAP